MSVNRLYRLLNHCPGYEHLVFRATECSTHFCAMINTGKFMAVIVAILLDLYQYFIRKNRLVVSS